MESCIWSRAMSIYRCNECEVYFDDNEIISVQPDGGVFHDNCKKDDYDELTHNEILEALND
jgi:hypothetical protein